MLNKKTPEKKTAAPRVAPKDMLAGELREIEEIGEKLFRKIEIKLNELREIEQRIDRKAAKLAKLLQETQADAVPQPKPEPSRSREIAELAARGMPASEIALVLDMPKGEVELILSLGK